MSTRKRPRSSQIPNLDVEEEDDELSTPQRKTATPVTALSTSKKRKLNTYGSVNASSVSKLGRRIGDAVGGLFKGLKGKENTGGKEEEIDELGDELGTEENLRKARKPNGRKKHVKDVFDLPSSGDEQEVRQSSPAKKQKSVVVNGTKRTPRSGKSSMTKKDAGVWDVPDSEDERQRSVSRGGTRAKEDTIVAEVIEKPRPTPRTSSARRKARRELEHEQEEEVEEAIAEVQDAIVVDPNSSTRTSARGKKRPHPVGPDGAEEEALNSVPPSKKRTGKDILSSSPIPSIRHQPQSSAKKRGRPKKTLDQLVEEAKAQESPRGILTPSKGRGLKSKKSVAFEQQGNGIDLGFKDIPASASSKKSRKSIQVATVEQAVEYEAPESNPDTACGVCSKTKVRKGNEMLLCDGCNYGVHLKCCGLSQIPDGDWFCEKCQADGQSLEDVEEQEDVEEEQENAIVEEVENVTDKDETCCAKCGGLDSRIGNKIILCDGCDFAVHVKCYDLPEFPKGDWYCRTCQAAAGEDPFNLGIEHEQIVVQPQTDIPDIEGFERYLQRVQRVVVDKLTGQRRIKLIGHDDEMQKVYQVVEQTVVAGEGNSMLVIGARGCGKTTLVESVISDISLEHSEKFHVVRLNGFIHTDDKIASKEIWRQLGREMDLEDDGAGKPTNYADTLASLLALLSHPSEQSNLHQDHTTKSVVFVLDEFDLFTTHSRQTLLYNLFDIAQARKAPIVVLGLTTRIDVVESLEKRVKSRFSHRYVHLGLPKSVPAFWEVSKQGLVVDEYDLGEVGVEVAGQAEFVTYWNAMIENLYTNDAHFKQHLSTIFHRTKSASSFFTSLLLPIASLSPQAFPLTSSLIHTSPTLTPPDSKLHLLPSLSTLSLSLLICACRLDIILDSELCNFAMVYDEYSSLTSKHKIQTSASGVNALGGSAKVWGKEVAMAEWERLGEVGLLISAGVGGGGARETGKMGRMWRVDVGLEEIAGSVELSGPLGKWCREI